MYSKFTIWTVSLQYVLQTLCTTDMSDCWCDDLLCLQKVTVEAPPGKVAGYVCQSWSLCKPRMRIENAEGETVLRIKGPCCQLNICGDIEFDVSMMSSLLENFIKHWALKILLFWLFHWKNLIFDNFTFCLMCLLSVWLVYFLLDDFLFLRSTPLMRRPMLGVSPSSGRDWARSCLLTLTTLESPSPWIWTWMSRPHFLERCSSWSV